MPPKQITDQYRLMLFHDNKDIPGFASSLKEFEEMWDHGDYSNADKRSIYESVLLAVLRKTCQISEQNLDPVLLEMALVKFLETWLHWGTAGAVSPGLFSRGTNSKATADPADIALFGNNATFLQNITSIPEEKAVELMKAAGLSVTAVTKAAASAAPNKMTKATATDMNKVSLGMAYADNVALRDLDSASVNAHVDSAFDLEMPVGTPATAEQQYQFLVQDPTCYALLVMGFRVGLKVQNPRNMEFLLGHIAAARMRGRSLMLNWDLTSDVIQGVTMDSLIDRALTFKRDKDGKFWMTHYPHVLLGRRASDGMQRLPILGSYAELAEVYTRVFMLMAVLHGDIMFGKVPRALFFTWMKAFFDKAALNLMQVFRSFNDKVYVYLCNSIQQVGDRFLMDTSRLSPLLTLAPFFGVHGSEIPKDANGDAFHPFLLDRFGTMHQIYSSGIIGNEDCGRMYWGIDPTMNPPTAKNQWNSVMVNPSFTSTLSSSLFDQQRVGGATPQRDPYLPGTSTEQAPPSPAQPPVLPRQKVPATPPAQVVIDLAEETNKRGPDPHFWNGEEKKALREVLKATYGLTEDGGDSTMACYADIRDVLFPGYFYACTHVSPLCKFRHAMTTTAAGAPYLDGSEPQLEAPRAVLPSYSTAIASGTLQKAKVPRKDKGKGKGRGGK